MNFRGFSGKLATFLAVSCALLLPFAAAAANIGYFGNDADGNPSAAITAAGHTPVALAGLGAGDLTGISVLWLLNGDNGGYGDIGTNAANVAAFVNSGGVLSFHDRTVEGAGLVVPGAGGVSFVRDFSDDAQITVLANNLVTNGPAGIIDDNSLDGGTSSSHGYATLASLPAGAVAVLSRGDRTEIVDFYFPLGLGFVYYSTMPLDYYFGGNGPNPPLDNFVNIYAVNEAAFQASLSGQVPEPSTYAMLLSGLGALALLRRRRA